MVAMCAEAVLGLSAICMRLLRQFLINASAAVMACSSAWPGRGRLQFGQPHRKRLLRAVRAAVDPWQHAGDPGQCGAGRASPTSTKRHPSAKWRNPTGNCRSGWISMVAPPALSVATLVRIISSERRSTRTTDRGVRLLGMGRWVRSGSLTAMTTSAPMALATRLGTMSTTPPSTRSWSPAGCGGKMPGIDMAAMTARHSGPSPSVTS